MDDSHLLHPNLLRNEEIIAVFKERQLDINNLECLSRDELMELYKKHIMPKPQRQRKDCSTQSQKIASANSLVKEVKRIKLSHTSMSNQVHHVEKRDSNNLKRNQEDLNPNEGHKRQRIQWP